MMKSKILLWFAFFLLLSTLNSAHGQQEFDFSTSTVMYDEEPRPCIAVRLAPGTKTIKKAWEDFVKKEYGINLRGLGFLVNKDILSAEKVTIKSLSDKAVDFRTRIVEEDDHSLMQVFVSLGYDIYLGPEKYPRSFKDLEDKTWKFLESFLPNYYKEKVSVVKEELEDLMKDQADLKDEIADNEKEMEKLRKENQKLEKDLRELENKIEDIRVRLDRKEAAKRAFEKEFVKKN